MSDHTLSLLNVLSVKVNVCIDDYTSSRRIWQYIFGD